MFFSEIGQILHQFAFISPEWIYPVANVAIGFWYLIKSFKTRCNANHDCNPPGYPPRRLRQSNQVTCLPASCTAIALFVICRRRSPSECHAKELQMCLVGGRFCPQKNGCLGNAPWGTGKQLEIFYLYIGWQWRDFVPYLCQLVFGAILWVKLVTLMSLKYPLSVGWWSCGHFLRPTG